MFHPSVTDDGSFYKDRPDNQSNDNVRSFDTPKASDPKIEQVRSQLAKPFVAQINTKGMSPTKVIIDELGQTERIPGPNWYTQYQKLFDKTGIQFADTKPTYDKDFMYGFTRLVIQYNEKYPYGKIITDEDMDRAFDEYLQGVNLLRSLVVMDTNNLMNLMTKPKNQC